MKTVLVTGATGFIGSHLVNKLIEKGFKVRAFVHYNSLSSLGWLRDVANDKLELFFGDVRDYNSVNNASREVDAIFHLAALISIPYSYENPSGYIDTNILGTYNVLEASKNNSIERVLITSTSEVYGSAVSIPMNEFHPMQAQSPYSASKIAADRLAESYYRSYGVPITIVRPFNTFGPRQSTRAIIPRIITQLLKNPTSIKLGSLSPIRDFNFVEDVVDAFISIYESKETIGQEINIASGVGVSIEETLSLIAKEMGIEFKTVIDTSRIRPDLSEVDRLIGDSTKLKKYTNWSPKHSFLTGLIKTIEFYQNNYVEMEDYIK